MRLYSEKFLDMQQFVDGVGFRETRSLPLLRVFVLDSSVSPWFHRGAVMFLFSLLVRGLVP